MRWVGFANLFLVISICFIGGYFLTGQSKSSSLEFPSQLEGMQQLPKSSFAECDDFFHEIGEGLFTLQWSPPKMQLPDLRSELSAFGKNGRPDVLVAQFQLTLKSSGESLRATEGERFYLVYHGVNAQNADAGSLSPDFAPQGGRALWGEASSPKEPPAPLYAFSQNNHPTPLWVDIKGVGEQMVSLQIGMLDEKQIAVTFPAELHAFALPIQETPRAQSMGWELGGQRVDTTLLVRQKARWVGADLFLQMHGGDPYDYTYERERLDFLDGPQPYSCFVKAGDFLVWKQGRWSHPKNSQDSQGLPLLVVKKVDEKLITFELWDPEGKGKTILNLVRTKESTPSPNIAQEFKFVGAKTWAQFIVESRTGGRMTLRSNDWLVHTQEGWIKLETPEQIDAFVEQKIAGPLFVLDSLSRQNGRPVLMGHLFNASRTEVSTVELASPTPPKSPVIHTYQRISATPPIKPQKME